MYKILSLYRRQSINRYKNLSCIMVSYHSFPDPNEKPEISRSRSNHMKTLDKEVMNLALDKSFDSSLVFPGIHIPTSLISDPSNQETVSSKLSNGLVVASQDMFSMMSSFAFVIRTGSSYEDQGSREGGNTAGATQALELSGFKSTLSRPFNELSADMERLGGMVQCISTRENILLCVDVLRHNSEKALDILAETILIPAFPDEEIEEVKMVINFQRDELPGELLSRDAAQIAAFGGSPLGNFHYCPEDRVDAIDAAMLRRFRADHMFGSNCVISAAGIEHDRFVNLVEQRFRDLPSVGSSGVISRPSSVYTGGIHCNQRELKEPFVKVALAFAIGGWHDPLLVPACVLQILLGGGSSFSAGGPGKGMYSRLYREVLNRYHWAEAAESFITVHEQAGILGIDGSCEPHDIPKMLQVIFDQLMRLALELVSVEEFDRAKNMLKSMMMMQLESRLVICEDIARQFVTYGQRDKAEVVCAKIDAVTREDLRLVAFKMVQSPPSVGCIGHDLSKVPQYEAITSFVDQVRSKVVGN